MIWLGTRPLLIGCSVDNNYHNMTDEELEREAFRTQNALALEIWSRWEDDEGGTKAMLHREYQRKRLMAES